MWTISLSLNDSFVPLKYLERYTGPQHGKASHGRRTTRPVVARKWRLHLPAYDDVPTVCQKGDAPVRNHMCSCCQRSTIVEFGVEHGFAEYEPRRVGGLHASTVSAQ